MKEIKLGKDVFVSLTSIAVTLDHKSAELSGCVLYDDTVEIEYSVRIYQMRDTAAAIDFMQGILNHPLHDEDRVIVSRHWEYVTVIDTDADSSEDGVRFFVSPTVR